MAVDPQGKDSTLPSLDSLIAAGGNSSAARSLRVKSQLRDRLGRWIEMGRDSKLSFLDNLGNLVSAVGQFLGIADREGYGRFYVKNDPNLAEGVYEFPTAAIEQIAATLDENYLLSKNIDVNGNKIKGLVAGDGIPKIADLTRTDLTPQDQDVIDNPLTAEEKDSQVKARLDAPAYESKDVIARIDDADLEDMRKKNVDWEKYIRPYVPEIDNVIDGRGRPEIKKPDIRVGFERDVPGVPFAKPVARLDSSEAIAEEPLGEPRLAFAAQKLAKDVVVGDVLIDSRDVESDPDLAHNGGKVVAVTHEADLGTAMITIDKGNEDYEDIVRDFETPVGIDVQESINGGNNLSEEGNAAYEKYKRNIGSSVDSSETTADEDLGGVPLKDDFYDRRRKDFQDTITEANPELAASLFGDNPDEELKKNVEAELDKIDKDDNFNVKFSAYESVAQSLLEGTFTPSSDDKMAWYPVVGKDNHTIGILDGNSFYAKPQGNMLIVTGDGANNRVESLEQFEGLAPDIIAANNELLINSAKSNLAVYDTDGEIANAIDSGATSAEIQPLLEKSPQYLQDRIFAEESQRKNFLSPDERAASNRIAAARTSLKNVDKVNKNKPAEKARLEPEQSGLEGVLKKLEDAGIDINNADSEDDNILQARDTAMYMSDLIEEAGANGEMDKTDLYDRLANSLLEHFKNKGEGKAANPKVKGKADNIQKITARKEGATLDAMTLSQPRKGVAVALQGDNEEVIDTVFFDEKLGNLALAKYLDDNKAKFRDGFQLGTWHDKENNEVTLDVIELFPEANQAEAEIAGQERNQQGIFKLSNKEYIPTGGTGDRGRARRERELARQSGGRVDSVGRLGDEDLGGESRVSVRTPRVSNVPDEWSADRLRVDGGVIPASVYSERIDKGRELGQILPSSDPLINVPVSGDANKDAKNFVRASRQVLIDSASDSPRQQRKYEKRFNEIDRLLAQGDTSSALEKLSNLGMDYNNFYHSGGRDKVFGISSSTDASEAAMDLYWYGRTASGSLGNQVNPDSGSPRIESTESFAVDVDDLGEAMLKSPTLSKDKDNVVNVSQVISDLTNSTSTAQTVDTLQQVANSLINGYLKNENLKFEVGDIAKLVDSIASVVKKNKAKKLAEDQRESALRLDSTPSGGDEDLGGDKTHLQQFKQIIDEIMADEDITEFFDASTADLYYNKAEQAATPEEYAKALRDLHDKIWDRMSIDEEWHEVEIPDNPLFPFVRRIGELRLSAPINFEKLQENQPDMSASVPTDRLADIELNTRSIDRSKLSDSQKSVLRALVTARNNALNNLKTAAQSRNTSAYEFNYNMAYATTKTIKKLVANSEARGEDYKFGSGESDRIDNFVVFEDSIITASTAYSGYAENGEEKVTKMEGLYVSKSGKVYSMVWDGQTSTAYTIKKDGSIGSKAGYVNCSWSGETSRGNDFNPSVTPAMLKTYDRYQRDGIGGANITFARLAAEKSGRHFAHSGTLTNMGANNSKGIDPADPDRHNTSQSEKILWMMKAPIFDVMRDNGWFEPTKKFNFGSYSLETISGFDKPIDAAGYRNSKEDMTGPLYRVDGMIKSLADIYKSKTNRANVGGKDVVAGVDYPEFMKGYVEGTFGETQSMELRRLITDMSYKDGISAGDALKKLKEQRAQLAEFKTKFEDDIANQEGLDYYRERNLKYFNGSVDFMDELIPMLENNIEKLDDPANRVERPKPFAKDSFKLVKKKPYGDTSVRPQVIKIVGKNADLINENPIVKDLLLTSVNYGARLGKPVPEGWSNDERILARRFSEEDLKNSLINALVSDKPIESNFAELDFARKYAPQQTGYVNPRTIAEALSQQMGIERFNAWAAQTVDGITGGDENAKALASVDSPRLDLVAEMDKLLAANGLQPTVSPVGVTPGLDASKASVYNPELGYAISVAPKNMTSRVNVPSSDYPLLTNNERFDLTNGIEDALGGLFNPYDVSFSDRVQGSESTLHISKNFSTDALEDALVDALNNGRSSVRLAYLDTNYFQTVPLTAIRDALQRQGVDTNELVKKRVTTLAQPKDEAALNAIGRMIPETPEGALLHGTSVIDITSFEIVKKTHINDMAGANSPYLRRDPITKKIYVVKPLSSEVEGWGARARDQEIAAQAFYRVMGVRASRPQLGIDKTISFAPEEFVVSEFIPETDERSYDSILHWNPEPNHPVLDAVRHGLPADILLDHIDGPFNSRNTLIDPDGNIVRIDGGGALMWDPLPEQGPKGPKGRERRLAGQRDNWLRTATPEQKALMETAIRDGSFEGEGINFSFDFFLNKDGWHWLPGYNGRRRILNGLTEDQMKQYTMDTVLPLTPDKIETVAGIIRNKDDRDRVTRTLISRRRAMLDRYGIEDTYMTEEDRMSRIQPTQDQRNQFYQLAKTKITNDRDRDIYLAEANNQFAAGTMTSLDLENRIAALQKIDSPSTSDADDVTPAETRKIIELAYALYPDQKQERDAAINAIVLRPYGTKSGPFARNKISELQAMLAERAQPTPSAADTINTIEEERTAVIQNGVDTTIYPAAPADADLFVAGKDLKFGDILTEVSSEGFKEIGRVVFNAPMENGNRTVAYVDSTKKVQFRTYTPDVSVRIARYPEGERPMQSEITEGVQNRESRNDYQNRHVARSTAILQDVKNIYPNHVELENGDLVVASRDFTTAGGDSYKYEVVVHRKPNEEFVTYVRETPINAAGEVIGTTTINKMSVQTHSSTHLKNRIAPLLRGNSVGKGIHGRNPRNWFNQGNNREIEVTHPGTGLPVPRSLAPEQLDTKYIGNTGIEATGDAVKDALIGYVADLVDRKVDTGSLLLRLSSQSIVSRSQINDIIERIQANRAFPGVNQVPYVSRDGENIVRVGDRVRHYAADGTIKEGIVRKRRPLSVNQKRSGNYGYSDVLVVKFDGRAQGTPIVAKNLEILRRADGSPASFRGELPAEVTEAPFLPIPQSALDDGVVAEDINSRTRRYVSAANGRSGRITRLPRAYAAQTDTYSAQTWERGADQNASTPYSTNHFDDRNVAQAAVLNWLRNDPSELVQAARVVEEEDLGSPIETKLEPEVGTFEAMVEAGIRETEVQKDGSTEVSFGDIPGGDGVLPIYNIGKGKTGASRLTYWGKPEDVGNLKKASYIKVPRNASKERMIEIIKKNAEDRLLYKTEGKHVYELKLSDGTVITSDDIGYEEFNSMFSSTVTGSHLKRDNKGKLVFDEGRIAAHTELLERLLAGIEPPKNGKPKMFFLGGGPASGKGNFTGALRKKYGVPAVRSFDDVTGEEEPMKGSEALGAVKIDPDEIKILLPEVREMHARQMMRRVEKALGLSPIFSTGSNDGKWAENAHEESSLLAKMLQKAAVQKGLNIVYDGTGDGKRTGIIDKIQPAKDKGYETVGLYMTTDLATAIGSAMVRKLRTGRLVPGTTQNEIYFALAKLIDPDNSNGNISELFDSWKLMHREPPKIDLETGKKVSTEPFEIATAVSGEGLEIKDPALWAEFIKLGALSETEVEDIIAKGQEYFREIKAERDNERDIALAEAGKDKLDASDLKDSDPRVLEIRNKIESIAARTGLTTQMIAANGDLLRMILDDAPISKIIARADGLRNRRNSNSNQPAEKKKMDVPPITPEIPIEDHDPRAVEAAKKIRKRAEQLEPEVTETIFSLVEAFDGELDKLENRLKTTESLARKIEKDAAAEYKGDIEKAASEVSDAIRYTLKIDGSRYTDSVDSIISKFESTGYEVRVKNFWEDGDDYQGINMKLTKNGITVELQLHTPESLETKIKELNSIYKDYRNIKTNFGQDLPKLERKMLLWEQMIAIAGKIPKPDRYDDLLKIGTLYKKEFEY